MKKNSVTISILLGLLIPLMLAAAWKTDFELLKLYNEGGFAPTSIASVGDITSGDDLTATSGFYAMGNIYSPAATVAAASYTLTSAGKASFYIVDYTDTGAVSFIVSSAVIAETGYLFTVKDFEQNANNNNITISTQGTQKIDEADTYVINAAGESVTIISDGTNLQVVGGYKE